MDLALYIDNLLVGADFMCPRFYEQMLLDKEHFTRSRKYFWAIPNQNKSTPGTSYIVTSLLVALSTYLVVFNMSFLIKTTTASYRAKHMVLVKEMQSSEKHSKWTTTGQNFEEFPPYIESRSPTEWLILSTGSSR